MVDHRRVPDGYVSGPAAATDATTHALARVGDATTVILVEGISDQIAVETLARALGRPLAAAGVAVVPTGGVSGMGRFLAHFGPAGGDRRRLVVLCDIGEEGIVRRAIARSSDEGVPVFVCDADLEDELIRAVTPEGVERLLDAGGTLGSFRSLQHQQQWRDRPVHEQLRRFLASGATRKLRYAEELSLAVAALDRVPAPLLAVLSTAS